MENLFIPETNRTPNVRLDSKNGTLEFSGHRCMPETSMIFFAPVNDWINKYIKTTTNKKTEIIFRLEYYNTSSSKSFIDIFKALEKLSIDGKQVILKWFYEEKDEDMEQNADDMKDSLRYIQVEKITYSENE
ncbi:MAG: DUF1987 domain-containing protein [Bacteroidetes bacterium]|nr:MAG: DUF1987 domain-containing protein [Bacteroidota bacterium]TAG89208.1 MAG: DUF1987 domain-containing protein [Bacteroidota bacterium]